MNKTAQYFGSIYPILIILIIPILLILNTFWNLKSFNRDANFIVRHQAISVSEVLKAHIESEKSETINEVINKVERDSEDILSISVFKIDSGEPMLEATTLPSENAENLKNFELNDLASGFDKSLAALTYDPTLQRNVWNVVVPMTTRDSEKMLLTFQLDTKSVGEILSRTSKDSFIILSVLVIFTLILLANHFYFYLRSLRTKQLEELDRLKDEFISMAAHELRAPITAITGYLDLLKGEILEGKKESINQEIGILTNLTRELNGLVDDLLNVSRIEQGRLKVEPKSTDINKIIDDVLVLMTPSATQKGLSLTFQKSNLPPIMVDPERLRQVITNLISNSIKYTLKGSVQVSAVLDDKHVKISVKDTGVGIPPDHMGKLFGKFHRVQDKLTQEVRGTGLGLWITKQIVELMGGKIYVESIYGSGCSFSFTIPAVISRKV